MLTLISSNTLPSDWSSPLPHLLLEVISRKIMDHHAATAEGIHLVADDPCISLRPHIASDKYSILVDLLVPGLGSTLIIIFILLPPYPSDHDTPSWLVLSYPLHSPIVRLWMLELRVSPLLLDHGLLPLLRINEMPDFLHLLLIDWLLWLHLHGLPNWLLLGLQDHLGGL